MAKAGRPRLSSASETGLSFILIAVVDLYFYEDRILNDNDSHYEYQLSKLLFILRFEGFRMRPVPYFEECNTMAQWYVMYTKPRQEAVALENLQRQNYNVFFRKPVCKSARRGRALCRWLNPCFPATCLFTWRWG